MVKKVFDWQNFITTAQVQRCDGTVLDALSCLINEHVDVVTNEYSKHIELANVAYLELDEEKQRFLEFVPDHAGVDAIGNITASDNVRLSFMINHRTYTPTEIGEFIYAAAPYTEFRIRVTFVEPPSSHDRVYIRGCNYMLASDLREQINRAEIVVGNNLLYSDGVVKF